MLVIHIDSEFCAKNTQKFIVIT